MKTIHNVQEFKETIMTKSVVMIHKHGCPFCDKAKPWLKDMSKNNPEATIAQVNKEDIASVLEVFHVKMYPTFVAFNQGKVIDMFYGDTKEDKVKDFVRKHL